MPSYAHARPLKPGDPLLWMISFLLVAGGVVMIYSASMVIAESRFGDPAHFARKQALYAVLGGGLAWYFSRVDLQKLRKWIWPVLLLTLLAMAAVLAPSAGGTINGSKRWIRLAGLSVQPSEFAKLVLVFYLADFIARKKEKIGDFSKGILPPLLVLTVILGLILAEPDLGSAVIAASVFFLLIFQAGAKLKHLGWLILMGLPFLYRYLMVGFRRQRILAFMDPWREQGAEGFQIVQSYLAFAGGGPFGTGLGGSRQKMFYLPEPYTDFIFPVIGEELGLVGTLGVLALFLVLIFRGVRIFVREKDPFRFYLASGITCLIFIQVFVNICVVTGLFPTKGLPLPFISFGGSSLWMNLMAVGLLVNLSRGTEVQKGRGWRE